MLKKLLEIIVILGIILLWVPIIMFYSKSDKPSIIEEQTDSVVCGIDSIYVMKLLDSIDYLNTNIEIQKFSDSINILNLKIKLLEVENQEVGNLRNVIKHQNRIINNIRKH